MPSLKIDIIVDDQGRPIIDRTTASMKELGSTASSTGSKTTSAMSAMENSYLKATAAIAGMATAFYGIKTAIDSALKMEQVVYSMKAVTGSGEMAGKELQFLREESERLGLVFSDTALSFAKFSAATRNTAIEGQETKKVFSAVAEAATALKLPAEQVNGIFMALQQMMSKGKVQAEELRGQLGERLPGAFQMAADAMGVTTAELNKMLEQGQVLGSELLPKLAEKLHETYGKAAIEAAQGGQAEINRFNNALFETKAVLGDALMPIFTDVLGIIKEIGPVITGFVTGLKLATVELAVAIDDVADAARIALKWASYVVPGMSAYGSIDTGEGTFSSRQAARRKVAAQTMDDIYQRVHGSPGQATAIQNYEAGTYTYTAPAAKAATKTTKALKDLNKEYEELIKNIDKGEQAMMRAWEGHGGGAGEDGIWQSVDAWKEASKVLVEYEERMQNFDDIYATNTANAESELDALLAKEKSFVKDSKNQWDDLKEAIDGWGKDSAQAIADFAIKGSMSFSDMIESMIADMMKMAIYQNITGPLSQNVSGGITSILGSLFGGGGGYSTGYGDWTVGLGFHNGGRVGLDNPTFVRALPSSMFDTAPRFHSGLNWDEYPAILQKGERVIPAGNSGGPSFNVIINNNNGSEVTQETQANGNGGFDLVVTVDNLVAKNLNKHGSSSNKALRKGFGARPTLTSR